MKRPPPTSPLFPSTPPFRSKAPLQSLHIQLAPQPYRRWNVVCRVPRLKLLDEPQPLLRKRQRLWFIEQLEPGNTAYRSEEHTSELQSHSDLVCRLLLLQKTL